MRKLYFVALAASLPACSHVDTGQIDYRVAGPGRPATSHCAPTSRDCHDLVLDRQYAPSGEEEGRPFAAKEIYSIAIDQAVMGDQLLEGRILGRELDNDAEIAILAHVFEFGANATEAVQRRFVESGEYDSASEDPSDVELKLIYYGDNIHRGQPLNFRNMTLKPRSAYNGGSIGIQLVVLEVDTQTGPMRSLLNTLARFGAKSVPVTSEVSDLLLDLGESIATGNGSGDDRLFEYRFVLSAQGDDPDAYRATFAPGKYVLRRSRERAVQQDWGNLAFDQNTSRLIRNGVEVRDEFYMVLDVQRYGDGTAEESYAFRNWSAVRSELQQQMDDRLRPVAAVEAAVNRSLREHRSAQWLDLLVSRWSQAEGRLRAFSRRHFTVADGADMSMCQAQLTSATRDAQRAERDARDALRAFTAEYQLATRTQPQPAAEEGETPAAPPEDFASSDRETLVSRMARYFMPWSGDMEARFASAASFHTFVEDNGASLGEAAVGMAKATGSTVRTCGDLPSFTRAVR